ncbi:hypothetical protein [Nonomuraea gerenzanensis]|uniref:Uncharacterized protein n=1 Tax=Nonomuraea gerenzanensis TaxID=93944 RepID=A0A1M4BLB4_9ACTN|nr:hypothetical protein [Nonomuraea gerenzanensis]UBU10052.1 hypothetical protein LCN96_37625 [Nonomuraea gerenzanensis]SAP16323.1 hypothetical protein BN4615_P10986 [Nonomuraea gerenzanensis]
MEVFLLLSLLVAGGATAAIYKSPAARAVADGAWQAGRDQARREALHGWEVSRRRYQEMQAYLRRPVVRVDGTTRDPGMLNLRWWLSGAAAVTAGAATGAVGGAYAAGCAAFAGGRTVRAAVQGGIQAARAARESVDAQPGGGEKPRAGIAAAGQGEVVVHDDSPYLPPGAGDCATCPSRTAVRREEFGQSLCAECYGRRRHQDRPCDAPTDDCHQCGTSRKFCTVERVWIDGVYVVLCPFCLAARKLLRPRHHSTIDTSYEDPTWASPWRLVRAETPGATTAPGQPTQEDTMEGQLIQGAGDKLSHTQLKSALARVGKLLGSGAGELDTVIAGLQADQLDAATIQGLRELQEMFTSMSAKCSALHSHVQSTHGAVAEAINAVGPQNVARTEHYAEQ